MVSKKKKKRKKENVVSWAEHSRDIKLMAGVSKRGRQRMVGPMERRERLKLCGEKIENKLESKHQTIWGHAETLVNS